MFESIASISNPGSLKEFVAKKTEEVDDLIVRREYDEVLSRFRKSLAEAKGISLDELHGTLRRLGNVATTMITTDVI